MFTVHESNKTNFNSCGLEVIDDIIISSKVEWGINKSFIANITIACDELYKYKCIKNERIIMIPTPIGEQPFRIIDISPVDDFTINVFCRHVYHDLQKRTVLRCKVDNAIGSFTLNKLKDNLDKRVPHKFNSDITTIASLDWVRKKGLDILLGNDENSFINKYGGELNVNGWNIEINKRIGKDRGFTAMYSKNIVGFQGNISFDNMITRIIPVGFDGITISQKYIDSPNINNYADIYSDIIKFEDIKYKYSPNNSSNEGFETMQEVENALIQASLDYFINTKCDLPQAIFDVNILMLKDTDEYKDTAILEELWLGDDITIDIPYLNLKLKKRMISYTYNSITKMYESIILGDSDDDNFFSQIDNKFEHIPDRDEIDNKLNQAIEQAFKDANNLIQSGGKNSYVKFLPNILNPSEILLCDDEDISKAVYVVRLNKNGLGVSTTGFNGNYQGLLTEGKLVLNEVTVKKFSGNLILANSINAEQLSIEAKREIRENLVTETKLNAEIGKITLEVSENYASKINVENINKALEDAKENLKGEISDVSSNLNNLEENINGAFKDGIINEAEAIAINEQTRQLDKEKLDIDKKFNAIYTNTDLKGAVKINLATAKTNYNNAHSSLKTTINNAISDKVITPEENINVNNKFNDYNQKLSEFSKVLEQAIDSISSEKVKKLETSTNEKISKIEVNANEIKQSVSNVQNTVTTHTTQIEAVDGKINTAKNEAINTASSDATNKANSAKELALAMQTGKMLYKDPTFKEGLNEVKTYNNTGNGNVTINRITKISDCPTSSTHCLEVKTIGDSTPGFGGFFFATKVRANAIYIVRFIAKLESGRLLSFASNELGDGSTHKWLSDNQGTGKWTEYIYKINCGHSGTLSNTAFFYVKGGNAPTNSAPLIWHLGYATVLDITDSEMNYDKEISNTKAQITTVNETMTNKFAEIKTTTDAITLQVNDTKKDITTVNTNVSNLTNTVNGKVNKTDVYIKSETYNKNETDSKISIAKNEINLSVKDTYETKTTVTSKINTAKTEAISSASNDATNKSNNAKSQAVTDAKNYTNGQITTVNSTINSKVAEIKATTDSITQRVSNTESTTNTINSTVNTIKGVHGLAYEKDVLIKGDSNKYYPVYVRGGNQDVLRTIKIWRSYSEKGPNDWNTSTHKGSLTFEWRGNFGGWGGADYREHISENSSQYTILLADCSREIHSMAYCFMLRGGGNDGAIYHFASDQSLTIEIYYNGSNDIVYPNENPSYVVRAKEPVTTVNTSRLNALKLAKESSVSTVNTKVENVINKTATLETNVNSITGRVSSVETKTNTIDGKVTSQETRLAEAEQKITTDGIFNTVKKKLETVSSANLVQNSLGRLGHKYWNIGKHTGGGAVEWNTLDTINNNRSGFEFLIKNSTGTRGGVLSYSIPVRPLTKYTLTTNTLIQRGPNLKVEIMCRSSVNNSYNLTPDIQKLYAGELVPANDSSLTFTTPKGTYYINIYLYGEYTQTVRYNYAHYGVSRLRLNEGEIAYPWVESNTFSESLISQTSDEISLKVNKNDIVSSINLSPESATIQANKINLQGYVTVGHLTSNEKTTINNAEVSSGKIYGNTMIALNGKNGQGILTVNGGDTYVEYFRCTEAWRLSPYASGWRLPYINSRYGYKDSVYDRNMLNELRFHDNSGRRWLRLDNTYNERWEYIPLDISYYENYHINSYLNKTISLDIKSKIKNVKFLDSASLLKTQFIDNPENVLDLDSLDRNWIEQIGDKEDYPNNPHIYYNGGPDNSLIYIII